MRLKTVLIIIGIVLTDTYTIAQSKLSIEDIFIGFVDSAYKSQIQKSHKGEIFHIKDRQLSFLYGKSITDSSIKLIIVNNEDSIKNYFSAEDFKYKSSKIILQFNITAVLPDTLFFDANSLLITTEYFNKKRSELIGFISRVKLYALYDRKLNKWIVDRLEKCIKCPDQ